LPAQAQATARLAPRDARSACAEVSYPRDPGGTLRIEDMAAPAVQQGYAPFRRSND